MQHGESASEPTSNQNPGLWEGQQGDIVQQVAGHDHALAQFKSNKPVGADGERVWDPFLTRENPVDTPLTRDLVNPDRGEECDIIWGREQNDFVFYHADLGPQISR